MAAATDNVAIARMLRVIPEYRRSLLYVALGGWAALALAFALRQQPIDRVGATLAVIIFGIFPPLVWIYAVTLRLVVDDEGLSRRRLWFWTHWPWEDFNAGHVHWDNKNGFLTNRARSFWDRWNLSLPFLETDQVKFVTEVIEQMCPDSIVAEHLKPPAPVQQLDLTLFLIFKMQVTRAGCMWLRTGELIRWPEITEFRIERQRMKGQCCYQLNVKAGSRSFSIPITSICTDEAWRSPRDDAREAWITQLRGLVPERCFVYYRTDGELTSAAEGEFRLKRLEDARRIMRVFEWIGWAMLPLAALFFGPRIPGLWNVPFMALGWKLIGVGACLLMIVQPTVMLVPLSRHICRHNREQQEETKRQMAALAGVTVKEPPAPAVHAA